jgi:hypothetical protein
MAKKESFGVRFKVLQDIPKKTVVLEHGAILLDICKYDNLQMMNGIDLKIRKKIKGVTGLLVSGHYSNWGLKKAKLGTAKSCNFIDCTGGSRPAVQMNVAKEKTVFVSYKSNSALSSSSVSLPAFGSPSTGLIAKQESEQRRQSKRARGRPQPVPEQKNAESTSFSASSSKQRKM